MCMYPLPRGQKPKELENVCRIQFPQKQVPGDVWLICGSIKFFIQIYRASIRCVVGRGTGVHNIILDSCLLSGISEIPQTNTRICCREQGYFFSSPLMLVLTWSAQKLQT